MNTYAEIVEEVCVAIMYVCHVKKTVPLKCHGSVCLFECVSNKYIRCLCECLC